MLVTYFIEFALRQDPKDGHSFYEPIGVWAHGERLGFDLSVRYVPGNQDAEDRADRLINAMVEDGRRALPTGFMEEKRTSIPSHRGDASPLYTTEQFGSADEVVDRLVGRIVGRQQLGDPPLPR